MEYVRLLLLLIHALIIEKRHDEASNILHDTMAHIIIGDCRMGAALCVAGVNLNLMRVDPKEALIMLRPLVCNMLRVFVRTNMHDLHRTSLTSLISTKKMCNKSNVEHLTPYRYKAKRFSSLTGQIGVKGGTCCLKLCANFVKSGMVRSALMRRYIFKDVLRLA